MQKVGVIKDFNELKYNRHNIEPIIKRLIA